MKSLFFITLIFSLLNGSNFLLARGDPPKDQYKKGEPVGLAGVKKKKLTGLKEGIKLKLAEVAPPPPSSFPPASFDESRPPCNYPAPVCEATSWQQSVQAGFNATGLDIALDPLGNVYVVGTVMDGSGVLLSPAEEGDNIFLCKLDGCGYFRWCRVIRSAGSEHDQGNGVATDAQGNAYFVGSVWRQASGSLPEHRDVIFAKYSTCGEEVWTRYYEKPNYDDIGLDIAVDNQSNPIVLGIIGGSAGSGYKYWLAKYSTDGNPLWSKVPFPEAIASTHAGIVSKPDGSILVAVTDGELGFLTTNTRIEKYNGDGSAAGVSIIFDQGVGEVVNGVTLGLEDTFYLTGRKYAAASATLFLGKFNTGGVLLTEFNEPDALGNAISVNSQGHFFVAGTSYGAQSDCNIFVRHYDPTGQIVWTDQLDDSTTLFDCGEGHGIVAAPDGSAFATGTSGNGVIWIRRYSP